MMNEFLQIQFFAQSSRFTDMGRNFRQTAGNDRWSELLLLLAILVVVGAAVWCLVRHLNRKQRRGYASPRELFHDLCEAHKLDRRERSLLQDLCRMFRLRQPAVLFVEPNYFDPQRWNEALQKRSDALSQLRTKLFGD